MKRLATITVIALLQAACASTTAPPSQDRPMISFEQIGAEIVVSHVTLQDSNELPASIASN